MHQYASIDELIVPDCPVNSFGRGGGGVGTGRATRMGDGLTQKDFIAKGAFAIALTRIRGEI